MLKVLLTPYRDVQVDGSLPHGTHEAVQVPARADKLERGDSLSELCCFPHWLLLRYCYFTVWCKPAHVLVCACLAEPVNPTRGGL